MWVLNNMIWIPVRKKILKIYFFHISIFNRLSNELPLQLLKEIYQKSRTKPELIMWILKKNENKISTQNDSRILEKLHKAYQNISYIWKTIKYLLREFILLLQCFEY